MEKYQEITPDLLIAARQHHFRGGTDNHPVSVRDRQTQQGIADCAADQINIHAFLRTAVTVRLSSSSDLFLAARDHMREQQTQQQTGTGYTAAVHKPLQDNIALFVIQLHTDGIQFFFATTT